MTYVETIPENMQYLFKNANYSLTEDDYELLSQKRTRAENLKKHNGAIYLGLTQSATYHLNNAYLYKLPVNKKAFDETINNLSRVHKPCHY